MKKTKYVFINHVIMVAFEKELFKLLCFSEWLSK